MCECKELQSNDALITPKQRAMGTTKYLKNSLARTSLKETAIDEGESTRDNGVILAINEEMARRNEEMIKEHMEIVMEQRLEVVFEDMVSAVATNHALALMFKTAPGFLKDFPLGAPVIHHCVPWYNYEADSISGTFGIPGLRTLLLVFAPTLSMLLLGWLLMESP